MAEPRPELLEIEPVVHGSASADELAAFGLTPEDVLDFSVSTNPLGPSPAVLEAIGATDWRRYPGDDALPLRRALAERADVSAEQVVLGNGSAELLWLVALAVLRPRHRVGILGPTFGEYARAARIFGADIVEFNTSLPPTGTTPSAGHSLPPLARPFSLLFVCNPNNPTGTYLEQDEVHRLLTTGALVVLDEAYVGFVENAWPSQTLVERHANLVIVRSFTKEQALPGLRLGYLLASRQLARACEAVRPPWNVNAGALRAGLAALLPSAEDHLTTARACVAESKYLLAEGLTRLGYAVQPSAANFLLIQVGNGEAFRRSLMPFGMVVRDCASFGLPEYVRVACRRPDECVRLLEAVTRLTDRRQLATAEPRWVGG